MLWNNKEVQGLGLAANKQRGYETLEAAKKNPFKHNMYSSNLVNLRMLIALIIPLIPTSGHH